MQLRPRCAPYGYKSFGSRVDAHVPRARGGVGSADAAICARHDTALRYQCAVRVHLMSLRLCAQLPWVCSSAAPCRAQWSSAGACLRPIGKSQFDVKRRSDTPVQRVCMAAIGVTVNCPEAQCIAFPGYVENTDAAVQMLGGRQALTESLSVASPALQCRPRITVRI